MCVIVGADSRRWYLYPFCTVARLHPLMAVLEVPDRTASWTWVWLSEGKERSLTDVQEEIIGSPQAIMFCAKV